MRFIGSIPLALAGVLALAGCEGVDFWPTSDFPDEDAQAVETGTAEDVPGAAPPTSPDYVPEAIDATLGSGGLFIGKTIASLGNPNDAGLWVRTPLVSEPTAGHVHYSAGNRSVRVELIPSGGAAGSGSQISLAAMRLLNAPLGDLLELAVYRG